MQINKPVAYSSHTFGSLMERKVERGRAIVHFSSQIGSLVQPHPSLYLTVLCTQMFPTCTISKVHQARWNELTVIGVTKFLNGVQPGES